MGDHTRAHRRFDRPRMVEAAAGRHWVMSVAELRALGMSDDRILRDARDGRLHRRFEGVYAVGRPDLTFEGHCRAALLACGPGSAISHVSAARLWGIRSSAGAIHVSVPRSRAGHPGLRTHRPRSLSLDDVVERDGLRRTSVARTLLDLAASSSLERVERDLHEARVQRVVDHRAVLAVLETHPGHRGRRRLGAALASEVAPTRSGLEAAFLALCRRAGLPAPAVNTHVGTSAGLEEVDFCWPELGVIVETDGSRYHATRYRRRRDAEKTARLQAAGWLVRRFSDLDVELAPAAVAAAVAEMCSLGRSNPRMARA